LLPPQLLPQPQLPLHPQLLPQPLPYPPQQQTIRMTIRISHTQLLLLLLHIFCFTSLVMLCTILCGKTAMRA